MSNAGLWSNWNRLLPLCLGCWAIGFLWHATRGPVSFLVYDVVIIPLVALLYWGGFVLSIVTIVASRRWVLLTLVPVLIVLTAVVNPTWRVAPRTWFTLHRPLFDMALATDPGDDFYGNELPLPLRFLTKGGRVSDVDGSLFFPQWMGIPADAGGYLYNPVKSPEGSFLYGLPCEDPVDLGNGWWMCGMADTGL